MSTIDLVLKYELVRHLEIGMEKTTTCIGNNKNKVISFMIMKLFPFISPKLLSISAMFISCVLNKIKVLQFGPSER